MTDVWLTSDCHFGSQAMSLRRGFKNSAEHDEAILQSLQDTLPKRYKLYVLGDLGYNVKAIEALASLCGAHACNVLIPGNHDDFHITQYAEWFFDVRGAHMYKSWWLSHFPVHPQELFRSKGNVHGHIHHSGATGSLPMPYVNVNLDCNNLLPISFDYIESKWENWVDS